MLRPFAMPSPLPFDSVETAIQAIAAGNFMSGVTAAASAGVYLHDGYIDPVLAMPVMLGVLGGSLLGARRLAGAKTRVLRIVFGVVVGLLALEMIWSGVRGRI